MNHTTHYLELLKDRLQVTSDYAIAQRLGVTRQAASHWTKGGTFDDRTAALVAEILKIRPAVVMAAMQADRAKEEGTRRLLHPTMGRVGQNPGRQGARRLAPRPTYHQPIKKAPRGLFFCLVDSAALFKAPLTVTSRGLALAFCHIASKATSTLCE